MFIMNDAGSFELYVLNAEHKQQALSISQKPPLGKHWNTLMLLKVNTDWNIHEDRH